MDTNDTSERPMPSLQEFLKRVNDAATKMGKALGDGEDFPIVIAACLTMLEHCVRSAAPEGRSAILENIRGALGAMESKINAEQAVVDQQASQGKPAEPTVH